MYIISNKYEFVNQNKHLILKEAEFNHVIADDTALLNTNKYLSNNYTDKTFEEYTKYILNRGVGKAGPRTIEGYRVALLVVIRKIGNLKMIDINEELLRSTFKCS